MAEVARDIFINLETVAGELYKHGGAFGTCTQSDSGGHQRLEYPTYLLLW
jgi:hypothetical protein